VGMPAAGGARVAAGAWSRPRPLLRGFGLGEGGKNKSVPFMRSSHIPDPRLSPTVEFDPKATVEFDPKASPAQSGGQGAGFTEALERGVRERVPRNRST